MSFTALQNKRSLLLDTGIHIEICCVVALGGEHAFF